MVLLDKLWDDVLAGPQPEKGLGRLRKEKVATVNIDDGADEARKRMMDRKNSGDFQYFQEDALKVAQGIRIVKPPVSRSISLGGRDDSLSSTVTGSPSLPDSPLATSPYVKEKDNVWRSVFHPGSNKAMDRVGSAKFDKALPNSPTVYDWLYSGDTKSKWR